MNNVLENTNPLYLKEVLIIDDLSDTPVKGWENDTRVRIVRSSTFLAYFFTLETNLGLINARRFGGNEARGEFLAFIDAHVFVSPHWLDTPHRLLSEVDKAFVASAVGSTHNCELFELQSGWRKLQTEVVDHRNRVFGHLHVEFGHYVGGRLVEGQLLAHHHGHVCNEQILVGQRADGSWNGALGLRKH